VVQTLSVVNGAVKTMKTKKGAFQGGKSRERTSERERKAYQALIPVQPETLISSGNDISRDSWLVKLKD